ncbi:hypothetical protein QE152_g4878 [Popillia japonica]|uniref:Retrotransposon gag domain-containing protein n=1 Tax=Popillia japonica TaxID=7064 RepID=A0AAW1MSG8_POPJA
MIRECLKDDAQVWWEMVVDEVTNIADFETIFMDQYWGPTTLIRARTDLLFDKYRGVESRENYLIKEYSIIKFLTPPMSETEIVLQLAYHFG